MDSSSPDIRTLRPLPPTSHHGTRYDPEMRETAYQLWAFKHGQNAEAVARELGRDDGECPGLEGRTVRRWATDGAWAERVAREIHELAPAIHAANVTSLIAASPEAIATVRAINRGDFTDPIRAGVQLKAAVEIMQRTGYPAALKVEPPSKGGPGELTDFTALSMPEIIERQRQMLERKA